MKILHALVAYLTVTALTFSPFAFAHPLAASIDHDGFVNTRQNQNDGDLMKRVPGDSDIIEARQVLEQALVIEMLLIISLSVNWIKSDKPVRGNEEEFLVDHLINSILPET
jgi:hypothetical protein